MCTPKTGRHRMRVAHVYLLTMGLSLAPVAAPAQQREPADSLARELSTLRYRLESLERLVARVTGAGARPDTAPPAVDELAALRAAAATAAGRTDATSADTTAPQAFIGRERNQAQLNPEISVTGDVRAYGYSPGPQRGNFDPHEFEVGFQSALDPYSHTKIFV